MKKRKKQVLTGAIAVFALFGVALSGITVYADTGARRNNIKSKGIIRYEEDKVVLDAADLTYLAEEMDSLESSYKAHSVDALQEVGTYYTADGSVTHDKDAAGITAETAGNLSFLAIYEGIRQSQSVAHLAEQQIQAASADNLSQGTAAWVNGSLLIGNGADNQSHYQEGYEEGKAEAVFTVRNLEFNASRSVIDVDSTQDLIAVSSAKFTFNTENFDTLKIGNISVEKANLSVSEPNLKVTYGGKTRTVSSGAVIDISDVSSVTITAGFDPRGHVSETAEVKLTVASITFS